MKENYDVQFYEMMRKYDDINDQDKKSPKDVLFQNLWDNAYINAMDTQKEEGFTADFESDFFYEIAVRTYKGLEQENMELEGY